MKTKTLDQKIAQIQEEAKRKINEARIEEDLLTRFADSEINASFYKDTMRFKLTDKSQFKEVHDLFTPTNKDTELRFAGKENCTIDSPYKIIIHNPSRPSEHFPYEVMINYLCKSFDVRISIPIESFLDYVNAGRRALSETQFGGFTGFSLKDLRAMRITAYSFKTTDQIHWYGGDKTLKDVSLINKIIKSTGI